MKIVWLIRGLLVLSIGSHLLASDPALLSGKDKHTSFDQAHSPLLDLECSFCSQPCFNKKKIALLPCGHIEHARCYAGWLAKGGACPTCREPVTAVKTYRRVEEAVLLLQECTFAMQRKLNDTKAQLAEVTAQRNQAHEQARTLTAELGRVQEELRGRNVQVAALAGQVNRMQSERAYFQATALMASGLIIMVFGMKKILNAPLPHSSTRQD